jgi:hypothetical protein
MTKEDIIRMAIEAGWDAHHAEFDTRIQTFAALVASAERKEWETEFAGMGEWASVYLLQERNR